MRTLSIEPVEEAARSRAVGAEPPGVRVADAAGERAARDLGAVDVEARGRAVVGGGDVLPLADGRASARSRGSVRRTAAEREVVAAADVVDPDHRPVRCRSTCRATATSFFAVCLLAPTPRA